MGKKLYWYRQHVRECPVCGHDSSYRERIEGKKPEDPNKVYIHEQGYDHCLEREDFG